MIYSQSYKSKNSQIDVSNLPKGVYILKVNFLDESGISQRIIIE